MSRLGKKPLIIDSKLELIFDKITRELKVKGPLGEAKHLVPNLVNLEIKDSLVQFSVADPKNKIERALWGTTWSLVKNMMIGVSDGFEKEIELNGVGYKMELSNELVVYIGFSHPVKIQVPSTIKLVLNKNVLKGTSTSKQELGNFFANLHNLKPCDPYKGKGFRFPGRFYITKVGKKSSK